MGGVKTGKVGKLENDEEMWCRSEEKLCKSIKKASPDATVKDTRCWQKWKKNKNKMSYDDITGKELPWHAVRKARELGLKYLRFWSI